MNENIRRSGLRMVVLIVGAGDAKKADRLLQKTGLPVQYRLRAEGSATNELMDYLGLESSEKAVVVCVVPKVFAERLMAALRREMALDSPGNGMAFSLPVSGASGPLFKMLDAQTENGIRTKMENEVQQMTESAAYSLILAVVNQGHSEEAIEVAKKAGAKGATIIRARRAGMEETMQFWGITLQSEKAIVAIVAPKEDRVAIMRAIGGACGMHSQAQGLVLSLPVDAAVGVNGEGAEELNFGEN